MLKHVKYLALGLGAILAFGSGSAANANPARAGAPNAETAAASDHDAGAVQPAWYGGHNYGCGYWGCARPHYYARPHHGYGYHNYYAHKYNYYGYRHSAPAYGYRYGSPHGSFRVHTPGLNLRIGW